MNGVHASNGHRPSSTPRTKRASNEKRESLCDRADAIIFGLGVALLVFLISDHFVSNLHFYDIELLSAYRHSPVIVATALYLGFVHVLAPMYAKSCRPLSPRAAHILNEVLKAWNLSLAFLSLCMFLGMMIPLVSKGFRFGLQDHICDPYRRRWSGSEWFWVAIFGFSKFFELLDTLFLVVRNRPITFLHWYHHASVLLYTWYAIQWKNSLGYVFAPVNAFVHGIMYWYYYRRGCGVLVTYDRFVTQIQISQMFVGLVSNALWLFWWITDETCTAEQPYLSVAMTFVMYGSYAYLFLTMYLERYNQTKKTTEKEKEKEL